MNRESPFLKMSIGVASGLFLYNLGTLVFGSQIIPWFPDVFARLASLMTEGTTWANLGLTLGRTLAGFLLAFAVGVPLGVLLGQSKWSDAALFVPVLLLQSCPPLFWVIPLILILGTDGQAPIAVVFLVILPLVTLNIRQARRAIGSTLWDIFRVYAPRRWLVARELLLPALGPALHSSMVLGLVLGLKSAVLGEWFGSHSGLGRSIYQLYAFFDMPSFFALVFLFLIVAAAIGLVADALATRLFPKRRPTRSRPRKAKLTESEPSPSPLVLKNVDFGWGHRILFRDLALEVNPGQIVVMTGRSGVGKTTLARIALGLLTPDSGQVVSPKRPAVLFQDDGLLAHRDVLGNVLLPAWQAEIPDAETKARQLLQRVGLAGEETKFPDELSGGMRKRVALARALLVPPDFVVLDEPFQNLDAESREALWTLTFQLIEDRGLGALIITHYPQELSHRPVQFWDLGDASATPFR